MRISCPTPPAVPVATDLPAEASQYFVRSTWIRFIPGVETDPQINEL